MARPRARFKAADVTRAVSGARAAGLDPKEVKIGPDGTISVRFDMPDAEPTPPPVTTEPANPWDEALG